MIADTLGLSSKIWDKEELYHAKLQEILRHRFAAMNQESKRRLVSEDKENWLRDASPDDFGDWLKMAQNIQKFGKKIGLGYLVYLSTILHQPTILEMTFSQVNFNEVKAHLEKLKASRDEAEISRVEGGARNLIESMHTHFGDEHLQEIERVFRTGAATGQAHSAVESQATLAEP
ncbi:MAG: hypothetical protein Q9184_004270 [Pyrenodesmia sp. 2 TL-2023]